jgi:riboflavin transporter FmnP
MKPFTTIAAIIFALMALIHAYRIAVGFPINIAGTEIGQGVSWIALVVTGVLSFGLLRESRR